MKELKAFFNREPVKRAIRTFVQTAAGSILANLAAGNFSTDDTAIKSTLISLGASAVAAGVAAVMNLNKEDEING